VHTVVTEAISEVQDKRKALCGLDDLLEIVGLEVTAENVMAGTLSGS